MSQSHRPLRTWSKVRLIAFNVLLAERLDGLRAEGVLAFDGTRILDRIRKPVYIDSCCHLTVAGEEALSAFVADAVTQVMTEPAPSPSS